MLNNLQKSHPKNDASSVADLVTVRIMLLLALLGFGIVLGALLFITWPTGTWGENVGFVPHFQRIVGTPDAETPPNLARRILDAAIYGVVIIGLVFLAQAMRQGKRSSVIALIVVSVLGLSYSTGSALYFAPGVSSCGFTLILFTAIALYISLARDEDHSPIDGDPSSTSEIATSAETAIIEKNKNKESVTQPTAILENYSVGDRPVGDYPVENYGDDSHR